MSEDSTAGLLEDGRGLERILAVDEWFAELDRTGDEQFMPGGRDQPSAPRPRWPVRPRLGPMGTTLTSITRDELRAALDAGNVTVVDGQPPAAYGLRHLPDALNVAAEDPDERVGEVLPDRGAAVVTCSGGAGDGLAA